MKHKVIDLAKQLSEAVSMGSNIQHNGKYIGKK